VKPGLVKATYGTGVFVLAHAGIEKPEPRGGLLPTVAWRVDGRVEWAIDGGVFTAGALLEWLSRELGFAPDDFVVGTAGRFDPIKNLPMLVRSVAQAAARNARIRGLLIGAGEQLAPVRALIDSLGATDRVRLTGFRNDARRLVQCMDLFVLASLSEGTSIALLEAVAAGVPVAVTAVGGNPEIVVAGQTGWVIASGAVEALSAAILEAAGDSPLRKRLSTAGRQRFAERFAFGNMISRYRRLYSSLVVAAGAK